MTRYNLAHPTRPDVRATYGIDDGGVVYLQVGIIDRPLFRITVTATTDIELYELLLLLVTTGFISHRDLLLAFRWSQCFSPHEIHDAGVRRTAELVCNLRHLVGETSTGNSHGQLDYQNRRKAAE